MYSPRRSLCTPPPFLHPPLRMLQHLDQARLPALGLGLIHVLPARRQGHAHQDALHPRPRRVQPKGGPAVVHQVELDVLPPADLLPLLLLLRERHVLALVDDGHVRRDERLERVLDKGKKVLPVRDGLVQVIKEDATNAARLAAVLVVEVLVTPLLEARVVVLVVLVADVLERLVELDRVLVEEVARGEVAAAAEPPGARRTVGVGCLEVAVVEVDGGRHGVLGVDDEAEPRGEELEALGDVVAVGDVLVVRAHLEDGGLRQGAVDDADADTGLLKHLPVLQHACDAAAALLALPLVDLELGAVHLLEGAHDGPLLLLGELLHAQAHGREVRDALLGLELLVALGEGVHLERFVDCLRAEGEGRKARRQQPELLWWAGSANGAREEAPATHHLVCQGHGGQKSEGGPAEVCRQRCAAVTRVRPGGARDAGQGSSRGEDVFRERRTGQLAARSALRKDAQDGASRSHRGGRALK